MPDERDELTNEELEQADGDPLPDREAMSLVPLPDPIGGPTLPIERPPKE